MTRKAKADRSYEATWQAEDGTPNPGTFRAGEAGCICPVMDNWRGNPEIGRIRGFIIVQGCPLHSLAKDPEMPGNRASVCACGWTGVTVAGKCPVCRTGVGDPEPQPLSEARRG